MDASFKLHQADPQVPYYTNLCTMPHSNMVTLYYY